MRVLSIVLFFMYLFPIVLLSKNISEKNFKKTISMSKIASVLSFEDKMFNTSNLWNTTSNFGRYGDPQFSNTGRPSMQWPGDTGGDYLWEGRFWIGAIVAGDTLVSHADYWNYEWSPSDNSVFEMVTEGAMQKSQVQYDDMDAVYNDNPIGIIVFEKGMTWSVRDYDNFIIYEYKIVNTGLNSSLSNLYVGWNFDCDIGGDVDFSSPHIDDYVAFDVERGMSYMWDGDNPDEAGDDEGDFDYESLQYKSSGYIGQIILESPLGGASSHYWWDWENDPSDDQTKYSYMSSGLFLPQPAGVFDYRWLLSTGPYTLMTDDTLKIVVGICVGNGLDGLKEHADRMILAYENNWDVESLPDKAPLAPFGALTVSEDDKIRIHWTQNPETDLDGYKIYRSESEQTGYTLLTEAPKDSSSYYDESALEDKTYYYKLTAIDQALYESEFSKIVSGKLSSVPVPPQGLSISSGNQSLFITWVQNLESDIAGYNIYRAENSSGPFNKINTTVIADESYYDTGLQIGTVYYYVITALDNDNNESAFSEAVSGAPKTTTVLLNSFYLSNSCDGNEWHAQLWYVEDWETAGNENRLPNPGEFLRYFIQIDNTGDAIATGVFGRVTTSDPYINPHGIYTFSDSVYFGDIDISATGYGNLNFMISADCPAGHIITINIEYFDHLNSELGSSKSTIEVQGEDSTPPAIWWAKSNGYTAVSGQSIISAFIAEGGEVQSIKATIISTDNEFKFVIELFDDGLHSDGNANDRIFAGFFNPPAEKHWNVDLSLEDEFGNKGTVEKVAGLTSVPFQKNTDILFVYDYGEYDWEKGHWRISSAFSIYPSLIPHEIAFDSLGWNYDLWHSFYRSDININTINQYQEDIVICSFPKVSPGDQAKESIEQYLDNDGRLLFSGQLNDNDFLQEVLHASIVEYAVGWSHSWNNLNGVPEDAITDGLILNTSYNYYDESQPGNGIYASEIDPLAPAEAILIWETDSPYSTGTAGLKLDNGISKLVYLAFGMECLPDNQRYDLMERSVNWLRLSVGIEEISAKKIPKKYSLSQNYPNPFNPNTTIQFGLPSISDVQIDVYNALGQKVQTLIDKKMSAGHHSVRFDGSALSSGLYFYKISAGKFQQVKKMLLIK